MTTSRRKFISTSIAGGIAASIPFGGCTSSAPAGISANSETDYSALDEILKKPVFKRELFSSPVIIDTLELLRYNNSFLCRVRSRDGAEGLSVGHSGQLKSLYPIFTNLLQPFFIGKDARDLDLLVEKVYIYNLNFRLSGMAMGVPLATIEFAILDMMGSIAQKSIGQLIDTQMLMIEHENNLVNL